MLEYFLKFEIPRKIKSQIGVVAREWFEIEKLVNRTKTNENKN